MRIGELAKRSGIAASTIRFYEQSGLLPPAKRLSSGYRDYDEQALERINLIRFCQGLGFSLQELPNLVSGCGEVDHTLVMERLQQKLTETDAVIKQLSENRARLHNVMGRLNDLWSQGQCMSSDELGELLSEADIQVPIKLSMVAAKQN